MFRLTIMKCTNNFHAAELSVILTEYYIEIFEIVNVIKSF